jgi:hypothetical protein
MNGGVGRTSATSSPGMVTRPASAMSLRIADACAVASACTLPAAGLSCATRSTTAATGRVASIWRAAFSMAARLRARSASPALCRRARSICSPSLSASMRANRSPPSAKSSVAAARCALRWSRNPVSAAA